MRRSLTKKGGRRGEEAWQRKELDTEKKFGLERSKTKRKRLVKKGGRQGKAVWQKSRKTN
jgi:hypothetical protein